MACRRTQSNMKGDQMKNEVRSEEKDVVEGGEG